MSTAPSSSAFHPSLPVRLRDSSRSTPTPSRPRAQPRRRTPRQMQSPRPRRETQSPLPRSALERQSTASLVVLASSNAIGLFSSPPPMRIHSDTRFKKGASLFFLCLARYAVLHLRKLPLLTGLLLLRVGTALLCYQGAADDPQDDHRSVAITAVPISSSTES